MKTLILPVAMLLILVSPLAPPAQASPTESIGPGPDASNSPALIELQVPREILVAKIPAGDADWQVPASLCEEDSGTCILGFLFSSTDGRVFLYDYEKSNLKGFRVPPGSAADIEVIEGISERPEDGAVTDAGIIYLLVDRYYNEATATGPRYLIYRKSPEADGWVRGDAFDLDRKTPRLGLEGTRSYGGVHLTVQGDRVYAVDQQDAFLLSEADTALRAAGKMPESDEVLGVLRSSNVDPVVVIGPDGFHDRPILFGTKFQVFGTDGRGRSYARRIISVGRVSYGVVCLSSTGEILGAVGLVSRRTEKLLDGKGELMALPEGGMLRFQAMPDGLHVYQLDF